MWMGARVITTWNIITMGGTDFNLYGAKNKNANLNGLLKILNYSLKTVSLTEWPGK